MAVLQVQAVAERLRNPIHDPAHHLRLETERIDREPDVHRVHHLGYARPAIAVLHLPVDCGGGAVDLHQASGAALVLRVHGDPLSGPGLHPPAPAARLGDPLEHGPEAVVADERATEPVRILAHRASHLVDHQLL